MQTALARLYDSGRDRLPGVVAHVLELWTRLGPDQARLREALDIFPVAILIAFDRDCSRIEANAAGRALLRATPGQNLSQGAPEGETPAFEVYANGMRLPPSDLPLQRAAATGKTVRESECELRFADGVSVFIAGHTAPLFDAEGSPCGSVGAFLDVSPVRQLEERAAQLSREWEAGNRRQSLLLQASNLMLRTCGEAELTERLFDLVAPHIQADFCLNYRCDNVGNLNLVAAPGVAPQMREAARRLRFGQAYCGTVAATRKPLYVDAEQVARDQHGALVRAMGGTSYACHPLTGAGGELLGTLSFGSRRRAAFEPDEFDLLRTICQFVSIFWEREAYVRALRWSEERHGLPSEGVSLDPPAPAADGLAPPHKNQGELERRLAEQGTLLAGLSSKLMGEKALLAEARSRVLHAEKLALLGQFVGNIVHDVNNVLAVVQAAAKLLKRRVPDGSGDDILVQADKSVERGRRLIRQLLDFARTDASVADVVAPMTAIRADTELLERLVGSGIELKIEGDADAWPVLVGQSNLESVVFNLVANARDACSAGGSVTVAVRNVPARLRPAALPRRDYVVIAVADTGCGMPPEVLARAGEPFFTTKGHGKGTGLGLASAFELADRCLGRVIIDSVPGAGTRVALYLPRASALGEVVATPDDPIDPGKHGGATLLLVENEEMVLGHLSAVLRGLGYTVVEATSQDEALAHISGGGGVDLVLADLHLGPESGMRLAEHLRRDRPALPFIFITGSSGMGVPRGELVFRKPISEGVLARAILEGLGRLPASNLTIGAISRTDRVGRRIADLRIRRMFDAWQARARELGRLPAPDDGRRLMRLQPEHGFLAEVIGDEDAPTFRYLEVGSALIERLGRPLVGTSVKASDENVIGGIASAYKRCLGGVPYLDFARYRLGGATAVLFERLIMPLSDDAERVSHLVGVATFAEVPETDG